MSVCLYVGMSVTMIPLHFKSLDPSLENGIGILKLSIPVSKRALGFQKSWSKSRKKNWDYESLDVACLLAHNVNDRQYNLNEIPL